MEQLLRVKGSVRLQIEEDGEIVGDSGWNKNIITTGGFNEYIIKQIGTSLTGSKVSHVNVGTNGTPASDATALPSEVVGTSAQVWRAAVTASTSATSKTLQFVATLSSTASFVTTTQTINNVGLFGHTTTDALMAGASYTASSVGTNQNVNITYNLVFETA